MLPKTHISLGLLALPVCNSCWQMSRDSGISDILVSPTKSSFVCRVSFNGLSGPSCKDGPVPHHLDSKALLNYGGRSHNPFTHVSLHNSKARFVRTVLPSSVSHWWWSLSHLNHICCFPLLLVFRPLPFAGWKFSCVGHALRAPFPFLQSLFCSLSSFSTSLGSRIKFSGALFLFKLYIFISFLPYLLFTL